VIPKEETARSNCLLLDTNNHITLSGV